jgi:hypothetical protein
MGLEAHCPATLGRHNGACTAYLEAHEIKLSGAISAKLKLTELADLRGVDGCLTGTWRAQPFVLELGAPATARWLQRIRSPKTLAQKIGLKEDGSTGVHVLWPHGEVDAFLAENPSKQTPLIHAGLVFAVVDSAGDFAQLSTRLPLAGHAALWLLRRKGKQAQVKESEIMSLLAEHGYKPTKTTAWSDVWGADRYQRAK